MSIGQVVGRGLDGLIEEIDDVNMPYHQSCVCILMAFKNANDFECWFIRGLRNCYLFSIWSKSLKRDQAFTFSSLNLFFPNIFAVNYFIDSKAEKQLKNSSGFQMLEMTDYKNAHWDHPYPQIPGSYFPMVGPGWFCNAQHINLEHFSGFCHTCCLFSLFMFWWKLIWLRILKVILSLTTTASCWIEH